MKTLPMAMAAMLALTACSKSDTAGTNVDNSVVGENSDANVANDTATTALDSAFILDAIRGDNGEVAIGRLAQAQGASQKVKDFGKMLVDDHGAHKLELVTLTQTGDIAATEDPTPERTLNYDKLKV